MKRFFSHIFSSVASLVALAMILGGWVWAYFALHKVPEPLVLHFAAPLGVTQAGPFAVLSEVGAFAFIVALINTWISFELEERGRFLGKLLAAGTLVFGLLIFLGFIAIINAN